MRVVIVKSQRTATHCNTLQHTAPHCNNILKKQWQEDAGCNCKKSAHCNTLQQLHDTATNILQRQRTLDLICTPYPISNDIFEYSFQAWSSQRVGLFLLKHGKVCVRLCVCVCVCVCVAWSSKPVGLFSLNISVFFHWNVANETFH